MNIRSRVLSLKSVFTLITLFLITLQMFAPLALFADPATPPTLVPPLDPNAVKRCEIVSMQFGAKGGNTDDLRLGGVFPSSWFAVGAAPRVFLIVTTRNCAGNTLKVSIVGRTLGSGGQIQEIPTDITDLSQPIATDQENKGFMFIAGEQACRPLTVAKLVGDSSYKGFAPQLTEYLLAREQEFISYFPKDDHNTYVTFIKEIINGWVQSIDKSDNGALMGIGTPLFARSNFIAYLSVAFAALGMNNHPFVAAVDHAIEQENKLGNLFMPAPCDHVAKVKVVDSTAATISTKTSSRIAYTCSDDAAISFYGDCENGTGRGKVWELDSVQNTDISSIIDKDSPCYDPNTGAYRLGCVPLISPIPGFGNTIQNDLNLGKFINTVVMIIIGLIGLLAVVRLVQLGIEYFTTDSINQKFESKKNIWMLVWAFAIAAGVFVIFNTINPYILELNFSVGGVALDTLEGDMGFINDTPTSGSGGGGSKNCPEGTIFSSGFTVCKPYKDNVDGLIAAAKLAGIELTGGGYRSPEGQIAVRKNNCASDPKNATQYEIYEKPSKRCSPPTAKPGTSMHESGYALDLMCKAPDHGVPTPTLICYDPNNKNCAKRVFPATKYCFDWLSANAGKYGYKNWAAENWHWSSNGH